MKARRTFILLLAIAVLSVWAGSPLPAQNGDSGIAPYPLKRISPKGFSIYKGILDWVPVPGQKAVAFAMNENADSEEYSLRSFQFSETGATSTAHTIASGLGRSWAAAAVWIDDAAGGSGEAAGHGLFFVIFEKEYGNEHRAVATLYVGMFDSSGQLVGSMKELLAIEARNAYFFGEDLYATRNGSSIGVVSSFSMRDDDGDPGPSQVHFIEVGTQDGRVIGQKVTLPLPQSGQLVEAFGCKPAWNGTSWLVPVRAVLYKRSGDSYTVRRNEALVCTVSGNPSHKTASRLIAKDPVPDWREYRDMHLAPYPGSSTDFLLFVKLEKPIPEDERKQDYLEYDFTLTRLDKTGKSVQRIDLAVPALTHKAPYDPDYEPEWPDDLWSEFVARDGTLFISRAHDMTLWDGSHDKSVWEQQYGLYSIDAATGAVTVEALSFLKQKGFEFEGVVIRSLSDKRFAVVNDIYPTTGNYQRQSYYSQFDE